MDVSGMVTPPQPFWDRGTSTRAGLHEPESAANQCRSHSDVFQDVAHRSSPGPLSTRLTDPHPHIVTAHPHAPSYPPRSDSPPLPGEFWTTSASVRSGEGIRKTDYAADALATCQFPYPRDRERLGIRRYPIQQRQPGDLSIFKIWHQIGKTVVNTSFRDGTPRTTTPTSSLPS